MKLSTLAFSASVALVAQGASAAIVTLDIQADTTAKTWSVFANVSNDSRGLASFALDVKALSGVTIASSVNASPRPYNAVRDDFDGFKLFRSGGTLGDNIVASQDSVSAGGAASLLLDLGVASPVLLATGTYTGEIGSLTAALHPTSFFNVFPAGYTGTGPTLAASSVNSDAVAVPEPTGVALLAATIGLSSIRRRRAGALKRD